MLGCGSYPRRQRLLVLARVRVPALLHEPDAERLARRRVDPGGRLGWVERGDHVHAGTCCVTQWTPPPPSASIRPGTGTISRGAKSAPSAPRTCSSRSGSSPHTGTIAAPFARYRFV